MELRYIDILRSIQPLKVLYEKDDIPLTVSLDIVNNICEIDRATEKYFAEKNSLDKKYLEKQDGKDKNKPTEEYLKKLTELNETKIDINVKKIDTVLLNNVTFAPKHTECISFMLCNL